MSSTTNNTVPISSTDGVKTSAGSGGQANQMASGIKGVFAKVHGAGEEIRGTFNQGVDEAFHEVSVLGGSFYYGVDIWVSDCWDRGLTCASGV